MAVLEINWRPSKRELRQFAISFLFFFCALASLWLYRTGFGWVPIILGAFGILVGGVGYIFPTSLRFLFVGMSVVAWPIGVVVSTLLIAILYFVLVTPIGWVRRTLGGGIQHNFDKNATTYWSELPKKDAHPSSYFKQY